MAENEVEEEQIMYSMKLKYPTGKEEEFQFIAENDERAIAVAAENTSRRVRMGMLPLDVELTEVYRTIPKNLLKNPIKFSKRTVEDKVK